MLGSILLDSDLFFKVSEFIGPDDFYYPANKEIFKTMTDLYRQDVATSCL